MKGEEKVHWADEFSRYFGANAFNSNLSVEVSTLIPVLPVQVTSISR